MAGTPKGGKKAVRTIKLTRPNFYRTIGAMGGAASKGGGFAKNPELARIAGRKGGSSGRRTKNKPNAELALV